MVWCTALRVRLGEFPKAASKCFYTNGVLKSSCYPWLAGHRGGLSRRLYRLSCRSWQSCLGSLIMALNSAWSARLARLSNVGASCGRNPARLSRLVKRSKRSRSPPLRNPHHAGDAYISLAIVVARVTSCRACVGIYTTPS